MRAVAYQGRPEAPWPPFDGGWAEVAADDEPAKATALRIGAALPAYHYADQMLPSGLYRFFTFGTPVGPKTGALKFVGQARAAELARMAGHGASAGRNRRYSGGHWWEDWGEGIGWVIVLGAGNTCGAWGPPLTSPSQALASEAHAQLTASGGNPVCETFGGQAYLFQSAGSAGYVIRPCVAASFGAAPAGTGIPGALPATMAAASALDDLLMKPAAEGGGAPPYTPQQGPQNPLVLAFQSAFDNDPACTGGPALPDGTHYLGIDGEYGTQTQGAGALLGYPWPAPIVLGGGAATTTTTGPGTVAVPETTITGTPTPAAPSSGSSTGSVVAGVAIVAGLATVAAVIIAKSSGTVGALYGG